MTTPPSQESEPRTHHRFSPSTLGMREACPCWDNRKGTNDAATEGERQHRAYETKNLDLCRDEEQAAAVQMCLDYTSNVVARLADENRCVAGDIVAEPEVHTAVDDIPTTAGYVDLRLIPKNFECGGDRRRSVAAVLDCKFGKWPVEPAETNLQGICYVLGTFRDCPWLDVVEMHFMCPYLGAVDYHGFSRKDIPELLLRVQTVVARCEVARADGKMNWNFASPNVSSCLFCGNIGRCPKVADFACKVAAKFAPLQVPNVIEPEMLDDVVEAGKAKKVAGILSAWCRALDTRLIEYAQENPEWVPAGYSLVKFYDPVTVDYDGLCKLAREAGVTDDVIKAATSISIGKLEDCIKKSQPRGKKKEAAQLFRETAKANNFLADGKLVMQLRMSAQPE